VKTAPSKQVFAASVAQSLISAVRKKRWEIAFAIAKRLRRPNNSRSEKLALQYFEREAYKDAIKALRSGKKSIARAIAIALYEFRGSMKSPAFDLLKEFFSSLLPGASRTALRKPPIGKGRGGTGVNLRRGFKIEKKRSDSAVFGNVFIQSEREKQTSSAGPAQAGKKSLSKPPTQKRPKRKRVTAAVETEIIERTPHMEATLVESARYRVSVFANLDPPDEGDSVQPLRLRVPKRISQFAVKVSFDCSPHFRVDGSDEGEIIVYKGREETSRAKFSVTLVAANDPHPMSFTALFRYNDRPSGKITRFFEIDGQARIVWRKSSPKQPTQPGQDIKIPKDVHVSNLASDLTARPADLRIEVLRTPANDGRSFKLNCYTPAGDWKGLWNLSVDSETFVKTQMEGFAISTGKQTLAKLESAGIEFWNAVPPEACACLNLAFANHKIRTISVFSEEPFVPWELMIPVKKGDDPTPCLGVRYCVGRWITGDFRSPVQSIPMRTAFIVAPKGSGLALAPEEVEFLKKSFPGSTQPDPVTYDALDESLKSLKQDIVHFICHGETAALQTLKLDPKDVLSSSEVLALKGFLTAFRRTPFVFLNACEVGQPVRALAGLGGFAYSFLDIGAAAVVAPLWSVDDVVAAKVCQLFYKSVLSGKTFGEAIQKIRAEAFRTCTDTFASYCYYGDPNAMAT
jgi:CHAT domain-containing protein